MYTTLKKGGLKALGRNLPVKSYLREIDEYNSAKHPIYRLK